MSCLDADEARCVPILFASVAAFCTLRPMHKHLAGLLLLAATTAGCTVKPGDYRVYRLAVNPLVNNDCTSVDELDPDHIMTENGFGPSLIAIYASDGDTYFLEDGLKSILGEREKNSYTFEYSYRRDDKWGTEDGFDKMFTSSRTVDEVWDLELKGKGLSGTFTSTTVTNCSGTLDDCAIATFPADSCVTTWEVFGSEVNDVDIEYLIGGGGVDG